MSSSRSPRRVAAARLATLALGALPTLLACAGDRGGATAPGAPTPTPTPGGGGAGPSLRVVAGGVVDDTARAAPPQALVVEVLGPDGRPVPRVLVRFTARPHADSTRPSWERAVDVCQITLATCGPPAGRVGGDDNYVGTSTTFVDSTDAAGRAKAVIRLGSVAGPARAVVDVPELGLRDSVTFTVRPGAPASVRFAARTGVVYEGGTTAFRAVVLDRHGNARPDAVTITGDDPAVATVDARGVVMGHGIGRVRLRARAGDRLDSAAVTVVPPGRLVGWALGDVEGGSLATVNMDGSALRRVVTDVGSPYGVFPAWSPDGSRIAFQNGMPVAQVVDSAGRELRTLGGGAGEFSGPARFVAGGDVLWVVHAGDYQVWRAGADGSAARRVMSLTPFIGHGDYGSVDFSADGRRVVYAGWGGGLHVVDLATGDDRELDIAGSSPRWSPDGETIAYLGSQGGIALVRADGGGRRVLNAVSLSPGLAWSPDGRYILARSSQTGGGQRLTRVADGTVFPFDLPVDLFQASWR